MGVALAGVSLPIFFTGLISLELFSYKWPIFPNVQFVPLTTNPLLWARNLVLPWITLAFLYAALYARLTRAGMLETMSEDYIRTARAKGLPERKVVFKHGLRAALTPDRHHLRHGPRRCCSAARSSPRRRSRCPASASSPSWPSRTRTCPRSWASSCSPRSSS